MKIRLGFVAMSLKLENSSPSKTVTYKTYQGLSDDESRLYRLKKITAENLLNTLRIMIHAKAHDVQVYRITSKLVPLATHEQVIDWDYVTELSDEFSKIREWINKSHMRVSAHPDHFTLLTSAKKEVLAAAIRDLVYHDAILAAIGLGPDKGKLVIHVGGTYKDKESAKETFAENFSSLPENLRKRITLENDDKSYTASDTLFLCQRLHIPMVFDVHHHLCNPDGLPVEELLEPIFNTWQGQVLVPKVHFSTPKSPASIRSHADFIDSAAFYEFLNQAKRLNRDFDIMLEAKNKDEALFQLVQELKQYKDIDFIDGASFEI
ncbi:MAG TPA: UV DNA damage repair endonuclease UvsE [Clostridiales bacterium]|nr:UV DNA damage repair endonuclease UvsE [Clostridiales bacterium]